MLDIQFNLLNIENKIEFNPINWFKKRYTKDSVNILFIDDSDMPVVNSIKKLGYKVKKVKDISNIEDSDVVCAQIIFIDFEGVGRIVSPQHQGAGLLKELKTKYGNSKYVVLYTAQTSMPTNTTMSDMFSLADARMRKDSDVTDFTSQIREGLKKLR